MKSSRIAVLVAAALMFVPFTTSANAAEVVGFEPTGELLYAGAGPRSVIADQQLTANSPVTENGITWYNHEQFAFTAEGSTVNTNTCDTNPAQNLLCWHTGENEGGRFIYTGYNYLQLQDITDSSGVYRVIYQSDDPRYYPAGDQIDVPVSDLDGWEVCWVDDWGPEEIYDTPAIYYEDLLAQCSGDYLLFGVASEVVAVAAEEDTLADTGFDATALVALGAVAAVGGALVLRRRSTN